ncbi:putative hemolysin [Morganella morganii]|uniref:putative hemolysin n=1 Tax=Morganella morganii TaxID=582 RepID=UPI003EBD091A
MVTLWGNYEGISQNPASVYCEQSGGKTETVKAASGWTGYCNLPGGERVEEWTYYRKNHK